MSDWKNSIFCEQFEARVSDYIDGTLPGSDRPAMNAHAAECGSCALLVSELRAIVGNAAILPPLSPSRDLWSGIADRLDTPVVSIAPANAVTITPNRGISFRAFAAAAALLVTLSSGVTYVVTRGSASSNPSRQVVASVPSAPGTANAAVPDGATPAASANNAPANNNPARTAEASTIGAEHASSITGEQSGGRVLTRSASRNENSADVAYEREITAMRRIVDERLGDLDSVTVLEIERNLRIIDKAINDSRRALRSDPRSRFLSNQLDRALENKLDIMRRIALL